MSYFSNIYNGIKTLLTGMSVTGKYFLTSRKGAITQQYPDNRETLKMFERFRGEVVMPHDSNNEHQCTGCQKCELACPNGSIEIIWDRAIDETTGKKKKKIDNQKKYDSYINNHTTVQFAKSVHCNSIGELKLAVIDFWSYCRLLQ